MATTAQNLIESAFSMLGILAAESNLTGAEVQNGLDVLNDILAEWDASSVLRGVSPVALITSTVTCPRYANSAIKGELALRLSAFYGREISPSLLGQAQAAKSAMLAASQNLSFINYPSTLPRGSGNYRQNEITGDEFFPSIDERNF